MMEALYTENLKKKLNSVDTNSKDIAPNRKTCNQKTGVGRPFWESRDQKNMMHMYQ